ncbi:MULTISPECIES: type II toxin-antitoxin system RelE/ParE family toxin [Xanthobacter]|uniref:type II toxin-antitoxin system RelE/ParE family toxin n=1 Tax=Xanthobacter TaxID=279 RepID=UPI0020231822|nr:type II toxin-antitoxin system RelE/ParE family toxin [Xanthobacter aminoxidans]
MSFRLRETARRNIQQIDAYLRAQSPVAAAGAARHFLTTFERLSAFPYSGHPTSRTGVRATAIPGTRYVVTYRVLPTGDVEIIAIIHTARDRKA